MQSRFLKKRKLSRKKALEIDITSLLDILVILLVFLLRTYNPDETTLSIVADLIVPTSDSKKVREDSVTVQVDKDRGIWVEDIEIGTLEPGSGDRVEVLYGSLREHKERLMGEDRGPALTKEEESEHMDALKRINIILDQDLPYEVLRKVMHTSSLAGFDRFKFIVMGRMGDI